MHQQYHGTERADFFDNGMMEVDTSIADFLESEGDSDVTCDHLQRTAHHALGTHDVAAILDEDDSSETDSVDAAPDLELDSNVATILAECDSSEEESDKTTDETWKCEIVGTNDPFQA
eukprot:7935130-Karenia_brevis.AAC.1